jgi:hypothetical protein
MGNLQTNVVLSSAIWPQTFSAFRTTRKAERRHFKQATLEQETITPSGEAHTVATAPELGEEETRRTYNRQYMRMWRKKNQERYRTYNREYQRKRHIERKVSRILSEQAVDQKLCGYGCGRPAVERIERTDPRTWKTVLVAYCGNC